MTINTSPSFARTAWTELRGYALLACCLALSAGFVSEFWSGAARQEASQPGVAGQPAQVQAARS